LINNEKAKPVVVADCSSSGGGGCSSIRW